MITTYGQVLINGSNVKQIPKANGRDVKEQDIIITGFTFDGPSATFTEGGKDALLWAMGRILEELKGNTDE